MRLIETMGTCCSTNRLNHNSRLAAVKGIIGIWGACMRVSFAVMLLPRERKSHPLINSTQNILCDHKKFIRYKKKVLGVFMHVSKERNVTAIVRFFYDILMDKLDTWIAYCRKTFSNP
jgi:hypothetical protein